MPAVVLQLFSFLVLLWAAVAEFPAGPGWEWVASMAEMGSKEFGEVAQPLVKMSRNALVYPEIIPIEGWALSAKVEPLRQAEGEGSTLALVYEEVEAQSPRTVIAFRGSAEGNMIDSCAYEVLVENPEDRNTTLVTWCYATYKASSFDYYSQALAYTMGVLEAYEASSVLLCGSSMGGMMADLAAAGVLTHHFTALPIVAFMSAGRRRTLLALGLSLQGHYTSIIVAANQWDPVVRLHWDDQIGTICLFSTEEPPICTACISNSHHHLPTSLHAMSQDCQDCASLTHDSLLLLDLMLQGVNSTCYLMEDSLAASISSTTG